MIPGGVEPTIVEVVTPWCGACRSMRSDIAATAATHAGRVEFVVLDATEVPEVAGSLGVTGTPTLIGYRDGAEVFRVLGRRSRAELDQLFGSLAVPTGPAAAVEVGRRTDRRIRAATGAALVAIGVASGPAWPLVAIGVTIAGSTLVPGRQAVSARRGPAPG